MTSRDKAYKSLARKRWLFRARDEHAPRTYGNGPPVRKIPVSQYYDEAVAAFEAKLRALKP